MTTTSPERARWTRWEVLGLAMVLPPERMVVVAFAVATGCDPGALWRARRGDIASDFSTCRVHGTKRKTRERTVPQPLTEQRSLLAWAVRHAEGAIGDRLFSTWTNMRRDLIAACEKLGIPRCSPNDLRRTYGTWLRAEGIEPQLIGAAIGHSDSRMVERVYGRLPSDALAKLLSERGARAPLPSPTEATAAAPEAQMSPSSDEREGHRVDQPLVRYLSGAPGQMGSPQDIADKTSVVAKPRPATEIPVRRGGIEPPTRGFSVPCSTD
jgi:hypothetical protein